MTFKISRQAYVEMMGPTTGDRVRLGGDAVAPRSDRSRRLRRTRVHHRSR